MVSSGVYLKSDNIRIVTLSGTKENHDRIAEKVHKLNLPLSAEQEEVEVFVQTLKAYCSDNKVDIIFINKRNSKGKHAGGAATFRNEGIIYATSPVSIQVVHPSTLAATDRRHPDLKKLKPKTKDLGIAYDLAFEGLE